MPRTNCFSGVGPKGVRGWGGATLSCLQPAKPQSQRDSLKLYAVYVVTIALQHTPEPSLSKPCKGGQQAVVLAGKIDQNRRCAKHINPLAEIPLTHTHTHTDLLHRHGMSVL